MLRSKLKGSRNGHYRTEPIQSFEISVDEQHMDFHGILDKNSNTEKAGRAVFVQKSDAFINPADQRTHTSRRPTLPYRWMEHSRRSAARTSLTRKIPAYAGRRPAAFHVSDLRTTRWLSKLPLHTALVRSVGKLNFYFFKFRRGIRHVGHFHVFSCILHNLKNKSRRLLSEIKKIIIPSEFGNFRR